MTRSLQTILLLLASNTFMTIAWYGHLKFKHVGMISAIAISWAIALLEYSLMVPANKIGSDINGGPFNMFQLKIIQEVVSISVFVIFTLLVFKTETLKWNHIVGFLCLFIAVYFFFKK
jgi:uncharacterized protein (DUF486 family)